MSLTAMHGKTTLSIEGVVMTCEEILDHGYLMVVHHWGSDESIIESARMSTDKGFQGWGSPEKPGDEKLLKYLWDNAHSTPFEFAGMTIEAQAPIITFREWHRHRIPFGYSELSARYTPMPNLNYIPTIDRLMVKSGSNKQANSTGAELTEEGAQAFQTSLSNFYDSAEALYQTSLTIGVTKELARLCIPVGRYSRHRATGNLRGWLAFLKLRQALTAQYEIRVYAEAIARALEQRFPRTMSLYYGTNDS